MDTVTKRTVTTMHTPGEPDPRVVGTTEETEAKCSVELEEPVGAKVGIPAIKIKVYDFTEQAAGTRARAEYDRQVAIRDGRVSVSKRSAAVALAALYSIEVGTVAANMKIDKAEAQAGTTDAVQEFATVLAGFTVKP